MLFAGVHSYDFCDDGIWIDQHLVNAEVQRWTLAASRKVQLMSHEHFLQELNGSAVERASPRIIDSIIGTQVVRQTTCILQSLRSSLASIEADIASLQASINLYNGILVEINKLKATLKSTCTKLTDKRTTLSSLVKVTKTMEVIPIAPLKAALKPFNIAGGRLAKDMKPPNDKICKVLNDITQQLTKLENKMKKILSKVNSALTKANDTTMKLQSAISTFERFPAGAGTLCGSAQSFCEKIPAADQVVQSVSSIVQPVSTKLKNIYDQKVRLVIAPANDFGTFLNGICDGTLGVVMGVLKKVLDTSITLPIPGGSKARGVGEIPTCCPSNYDNAAGVCYRRCPSDQETVLFTCITRCPGGSKTVGNLCLGPGFRVRTRTIRGRDSGIPARWPGSACACRSSKKYLEAGLCYNKCGRDQFKNFPTAVLTTCFDFRPKTIRVTDLLGVLNIFDRIKEIPGLGDALKFIDGLLDKLLSPITNKILELANIAIPGFSVSFPTFDISIAEVQLNSLLDDLQIKLTELSGLTLNLQCP